MSRGWLRLRALVDRQYALIVAALVVLALVGGWLTYGAYATPETHTEERTIASWETTGEFDHRATVTEENSLFPRESELSNRTTYFRSVAPVLDGTFHTGYSGADSGDLSVQVNVTLVLRSVGGDEENSTVYWRTNRSLGHATADSLSPGESVSASFSVDTNAVENRTNQIRTELGGGTGEVRTSVRTTARYAGTVDGERVEYTETHSLPIETAGSIYRVEDPGTSREPYDLGRTETVVEKPGLVSGIGGPILFVGSLLYASALVVARRRGTIALTDPEREWVEFREDRSDFDEWVVTMRLPDEVEDMPRAEAATLSDLVDFAIDTDNAVVEHPDTGTFSVVHDGYNYVYAPPSNPTVEKTDDEFEDDADQSDDDADFDTVPDGFEVVEEFEDADGTETTDETDDTEATSDTETTDETDDAEPTDEIEDDAADEQEATAE